jgi:hypothetical protein
MSAYTGKNGAVFICIAISVLCVSSLWADEKTPPPVDPNLKFEVKEFALPANDARKETQPYKVILRFKEAQNELFINSPNDRAAISKDTSEQTGNPIRMGYRNWLYTGTNDDNTFTILLRTTTEQDAKIMAANTLRLIQDKRDRTLKQMQESIASLKSQIEKWPDEINTSKKEKEQLEIKIEGGKKTAWAVMSDAELQAFILELKKAILMVNCEIAGAQRKLDILKQKTSGETDPLWTDRVTAEAELDGFNAKEQATADLLNTIERFLADKSRMEFLAKDIPAKEDQLKRTPEYLKKRERQLAEMKPIKLTEDVIQIEHYQIAQ